jgi:tryptophanyl-tRNA synthetase
MVMWNAAGRDGVDCKKLFARNLNTHLEPFRSRRAALDQKPGEVWEVLEDGARRARKIAEKTIQDAKEAIGLP